MSSIYNPEIWERILEYHPDLKQLAIENGIVDNPKKAQRIRQKLSKLNQFFQLEEKERKLATTLAAVEFVEKDVLKLEVLKGSLAYSIGEFDDAKVSFDMILEDFNWSFRCFITECQKRNIDIENISFKTAYEVFLEVIELKLDYQIPLTKLFIRTLLEMSSNKSEDLLEIRKYFQTNNPIMLSELDQQ